MYTPSNPYTTEGIPANNSTAGCTIFTKLFGAISLINTAVNTPIGTPINIAIVVPTMEVKIIHKIPKLGSAAVGAHVVVNNISTNPTSNIAGVPFLII